MEEKINENSKRQIEILREDTETLNNKIEGNNETLKQQINEKMEEHSDTLRKHQEEMCIRDRNMAEKSKQTINLIFVLCFISNSK